MGGVRKKKWTGSKANQYISRGRACRKLQLTLPAFRKLCILKGIYPHDPKLKHKKEGHKRVYYHVKDIKYLRREPILWQYRRQTAFRKKLLKHKGRHNFDKVKRMQHTMPQVTLDHLVRERYPKFSDALNDLDDCISMVWMFATVPSGKVRQLTSDRRIECQRLCKEWQYYVSQCGLLRKSFVSVKGVYYEAQLRGKYFIRWLAPHNLCHRMPEDVDYRVMSTFLDFYQTMMKFVLFRLFRKSLMKYPPFGEIDYDLTNHSLSRLTGAPIKRRRRLNIKPTSIKNVASANNNYSNASNGSNANKRKDGSKLLQGINSLLDEFASDEEIETAAAQDAAQTEAMDATDAMEAMEVAGSGVGKQVIENGESKTLDVSKIIGRNVDKQEDADDAVRSKKVWKRSNLFDDYVFFLNRETPQLSLEFVILSMGGKVILQQNDADTWNGGIGEESDLITHQVVDREIDADSRKSTREYVQPQWVYDCLNAGIVAPTEFYQPGVQCPPHLSPFVDYAKHGHVPSQQYVIEHWKELAAQYNGFVPNQKLADNSKEQKEVDDTEMDANDENEENEENEEDMGQNGQNGQKSTLGLDLNDIINDDDDLNNFLGAEDDTDMLENKTNNDSEAEDESDVSDDKDEDENENKNENESGIEKNVSVKEKNGLNGNKVVTKEDKVNIAKSLKLSRKNKNGARMSRQQQELDKRRIEMARTQKLQMLKTGAHENIAKMNETEMEGNEMEVENTSEKNEYTLDDLKSSKEKLYEKEHQQRLAKSQKNLAKSLMRKSHRKKMEKMERNNAKRKGFVNALAYKQRRNEERILNYK